MAEIKTQRTDVAVEQFLATVPDERRRAEGFAVLELMKRVTGVEPVMWGPTMVGFGAMTYKGKTTEGEWFIVGFSPRKASMTLYGLQSQYDHPEPLLEKLGPHTTGVSCVYVKRLESIDMDVLESLVRQTWQKYAGR